MATSTPRSVKVGIVGVGGVGTNVLSQLLTLQTAYPQIHPAFITRSTKTLITPKDLPLDLKSWSEDLSTSDRPPLSPKEMLGELSDATQKGILIDNTSSEELAAEYPKFLAQGISIVTPNKKAFSSSLAHWKAIFAAAYSVSNPYGGHVYHESTVGAGLPIISTLKDLIKTGDKVLRIEGVFSGTLSFLFNNFAPVDGGAKGGKWSEEVKKAKDAGYTEPDPRDDLNGMDVARKVVILARIAGVEVEGVESFPVESLIPKELEKVGSGDEFLARLPEFDEKMEEVKRGAEKEGKVVRYVGSIDVVKKELRVGLDRVDKGSPVAGLKGSDNLVSFYTERYGQNPLVVQGAGAGGAVTAMGVTADLIKVLERIV